MSIVVRIQFRLFTVFKTKWDSFKNVYPWDKYIQGLLQGQGSWVLRPQTDSGPLTLWGCSKLWLRILTWYYITGSVFFFQNTLQLVWCGRRRNCSSLAAPVWYMYTGRWTLVSCNFFCYMYWWATIDSYKLYIMYVYVLPQYYDEGSARVRVLFVTG